jgi:hypothetical protein
VAQNMRQVPTVSNFNSLNGAILQGLMPSTPLDHHIPKIPILWSVTYITVDKSQIRRSSGYLN